MVVRYRLEVTDDARRAIAHHYGETGLATRARIVAWLDGMVISTLGDLLTELADQR